MQYIYTQDGIYIINKPAGITNPLQHLIIGDFFVIYKAPEDCPFVAPAIISSITEGQSAYQTRRSLEKLGALKDVMIHAFYQQNLDRPDRLKEGDEENEVSRFRRIWELTNIKIHQGSVSHTASQINEPYSFNVTHGIDKVIIDFMTLYLKTLNETCIVFDENCYRVSLEDQIDNQKKVIEKMIELGVITGELEFHPFKTKPSEDLCLPYGESPPDFHNAGY